MARVAVTVPSSAKKGEVIEIKTLAAHVMENGFRHTQEGKPIPRDIITQFICLYNGVEIFRAELYPAMAANPLLVFNTVATESGTLEFKWVGDNDYAVSQSATLIVV